MDNTWNYPFDIHEQRVRQYGQTNKSEGCAIRLRNYYTFSAWDRLLDKTK